MSSIFDSHAHYDDSSFDEDRESLLLQMKQKNVSEIINVGVDLKSSLESINLSKKYTFIYSAVGVHPQECLNLDDNYLTELSKMLKEPKVVAIGEIGLDYHYDISNKEKQIKIFEEQLDLAVKHDIPVIVHDRDAHEDTMNLLKKYHPKGVVHCFSGSTQMADEVIKLGMYIGLGGVVTFKNAKKPVEVAKHIPIDRILIETDAPYMAPVPHRGKRCDSSLIEFTAQKIAEIRNTTSEKILNETRNNALKLFSITI